MKTNINLVEHDSNIRANHAAHDGLIMQDIGTMPHQLRQLGAWIYFSLTTEQPIESMEEAKRICDMLDPS